MPVPIWLLRTLRPALLSTALGLAAASAQAALPLGATAPLFSTTAALGGQALEFALEKALENGPVVLYFFPKAFTEGCTIEAHAFAEATPKFRALGATVVGMSNDDIATLQRFSSEACRNQFAVAADPQAETIRAYDAAAATNPQRAQRISYVIGPDGKVRFVHQGSDPEAHVQQTLAAVQRLKAGASK